jgi:hypothetical protein
MNGHDVRTNQSNTYRRAFWIAVLATMTLALVASVLWWRLNQARAMSKASDSSTAHSMQDMSASVADSESRPTGEMQGSQIADTPLAPIQLTPQRMQSIGVVLGKVESKPVNSELRFYGNVQVDERRLAYVQTRFAGWIRRVYADATGNLISKGQPLFTIYSPDLVATEQEYLLAKKNAESLQQSSVSGVASGVFTFRCC